MNFELKEGFLPMTNMSPVSGLINCSSAAPAIATDPATAVYIALTNTNTDSSVDYAVYNEETGNVISQGTLSVGNSKSITIAASNQPNVVRIQNQSACDASGVTPQLSYAVSFSS